MKDMLKIGNKIFNIKETEFLSDINKYANNNRKTLEEMITISTFDIEGKTYKFRYGKEDCFYSIDIYREYIVDRIPYELIDEERLPDLYDLYREWIDNIGHMRYRIKNPDDYKIADCIKVADDKYEFKLTRI